MTDQTPSPEEASDKTQVEAVSKEVAEESKPEKKASEPAAEKKSAGKKRTKPSGGRKKSKRQRRTVVQGCVHIKTTFNNTHITFTDESGNVLAWSKAGVKFKGPQKNTAFAANEALEMAASKARDEYGVKKVAVFIKGGGSGREVARNLPSLGIAVVLLKDVSGIAHNGCRKKGRRRV